MNPLTAALTRAHIALTSATPTPDPQNPGAKPTGVIELLGGNPDLVRDILNTIMWILGGVAAVMIAVTARKVRPSENLGTVWNFLLAGVVAGAVVLFMVGQGFVAKLFPGITY